MKKLVFATGNEGKLKEVRKIFSNTKHEIIPMSELGGIEDIEETGKTFEANALIKAKYIYDKFKLPSIADDSGLSIEQLGGRPGVYSARYAGEDCSFDDNNRKVIEELKEFTEPHRAKFICFALYYDGRIIRKSVGELPGQIIKELKGTNGFGYDPIFIPEGFDRTLAEMSIEEKNKISHRAKAFGELKEILLKEEV
ncbi:MAG: RdgB/HAM1 family non-canonical purine NTP pyrophosphatase [Melioribacteraceae bacterium]|nr:RdgB/HAM1 family non-canonical purine NTP pyrophosphatase [Melioribacteraceae bacterium]